MPTITINVAQNEVYDEVAKATDYTGTKLLDTDSGARDRIRAVDENLKDLTRFWDESVSTVNERFKQLLVSGTSASTSGGNSTYNMEVEISKSFDTALTKSVESNIKSFFIMSIIGQWFKFANKNEANDYLLQAEELLTAAERLIYSRKRPSLPTD